MDRRLKGGAGSARSLLLTLLGEFALPRDAPIWTGALVGGLSEVDVEEKAARQALARAAAEGLLASERNGRRTQWRLTPAGHRLLIEGTVRIYGFGRGIAEWDGRWLLLLASVPETQRQLRHRLRTRLTWVGLGSPTPGLWVTPDVSKEKEVADVVADLGVQAFSFTGPFGQIGSVRQVVGQAWALGEVAQRYDRFTATVGAERPGSRAEAFRAQVRLVEEWRRFPFLDPALPAELLPVDWPGPAATDLFHRRHDEWHAAAQAYWDDLAAAAAARS